VLDALTPAEREAAERLIALALAEDLGERGDVTSIATIPVDLTGRADLITRAQATICGCEVAVLVAKAVDQKLEARFQVNDGDPVERGHCLGSITGTMRSLLAAERTTLNFLQRLSGIATLTRRYVDAAGPQVQVLDTRKTTPGWRLLEKYAVRCGGGHNHRVGLYDQVLIKDNHLAALGGGPDSVRSAITVARTQTSNLLVEVEVDSFELFVAALESEPDIILLDNMNVQTMKDCVARRNAEAPGVRLEASGGINLVNIAAVAATGVDRISVGALTHSAPAVDIALDYRQPTRPK